MKDLTYIQKKVLEVVSQHPRYKPITGLEIAKIIELKDRDSGKEGADMRSVIHALRVKGYPICANGKGYWYARTEEELSKYIFGFQGRVNKEQAAVDGLKKAFSNVGMGFQNIPNPDVMRVQSKSQPKVFYEVRKSERGVLTCNCPAFNFRSKCSHVDKIYEEERSAKFQSLI